MIAALLASTVMGMAIAASPPNVLVLIVDDLDSLLGGMDSWPTAKERVIANGVNIQHGMVNSPGTCPFPQPLSTFYPTLSPFSRLPSKNPLPMRFFTSFAPPVCCMSRSQLYSSRYGHNQYTPIGGCMHMASDTEEWRNSTIVAQMKRQGLPHKTAAIGKYLNTHEFFCGANSKLYEGWDRFYTMCTDSNFFDQTFNIDGEEQVIKGYTTSVIGNETVRWIRETVEAGDPFLAWVTPHAPHIADGVYPYVTQAAPWYDGVNEFRGQPLPQQAPRVPNYNFHAADHHWLWSQQPPMTQFSQNWTDFLFRQRFRSMWSVDDLLSASLDLLEELGVANNTYIILSSDHGYSLGNLRQPSCKLQMYTWNTQVPLVFAGPGLKKNYTISDQIVSNVDIGATILDLLGGDVSSTNFDGKSAKPILMESEDTPSFRDRFLVEYWSLGTVWRGAPWNQSCNPNEATTKPGCPQETHLVDVNNNTYLALRVVNDTANYNYAEFWESNIQPDFPVEDVYFRELYDINTDPWQQKNLAIDPSPDIKALMEEFSQQMHAYHGCKGAACP